MRTPTLLGLLITLPLLAGCLAPQPSEPTQDALDASGTVGLILRDHGEFIEYNASSFETLKALVDAFWPYTNAPQELLEIDTGTWYIDAGRVWDEDPHVPVALHDAWAGEGPLAAVPVRDPVNITAIPHELELTRLYYHTPGVGPGVGEGDLYELFGLAVYRKFLLMDNYSPHWDQSSKYWDFIQAEMDARGIPVAFSHSEDPHIDPAHTFEGAAQAMVDAGVDTVVSVYQGALGSDFDACIKRPELEHALRDAGFTGTIVHHEARLALRSAWAQASAEHVAAAAATLDPTWDVAVMDVHHGFPPNGSSLCQDRHDPYHDAAAEASTLFETALRREADRPLSVLSVYNEFAHDRGDDWLDPSEALDRLRPAHDAVLVVSPYFAGDGMDLLVTLREALGAEPINAPYHDAGFETRQTLDGTLVWTLSSDHGAELRKQALLEAVLEALEVA